MGTKRSVLTDEHGLPLSVVLDGANRHDIKLLEDTLDGIVAFRPDPTEDQPQNLCLDAGYTGSTETVEQRGYIAHIRPRGEEKKEKEQIQTLKPAAGSLKLLILFSIAFANYWFASRKKLPTILLSFNSPAPLLSGAN